MTTPQGDVVIAWQHRVDDVDDESPFEWREELMVAIKPAGLPLGEPQMIDRSIHDCTVALDVDEEGNVALSWETRSPGGPDRRVSTRAPGEQFGPPRSLDLGSSVAVDVTGGDLAASGTVQDGRTTTLDVAIAPDGDRFDEPTTVITAAPRDTFYGSDVWLSPDGEVTAIWARLDRVLERYFVESASVSPTGVVGEIQTLADSTTVKSCPRLDGDATGVVAAIWRETGCNQDSLLYSTRQPGGQFSAARTIAVADEIRDPMLDVSDDGVVHVSYWAGGSTVILTGMIGDPLAFASLLEDSRYEQAVGTSDSGVISVAGRHGKGFTIGDLEPSGQMSSGTLVPGANRESVIAPLGPDGAAVMTFEWGQGIELQTGALDGAGLEEPVIVPRRSFELRRVNAHWKPTLKRSLSSIVTCSMDCTVEPMAKLRATGKRLTVTGQPIELLADRAERVSFSIPLAWRRSAQRALRAGRPVLARVRLVARSADGQVDGLNAKVALRR